jgi:hypothetical protein
MNYNPHQRTMKRDKSFRQNGVQIALYVFSCQTSQDNDFRLSWY